MGPLNAAVEPVTMSHPQLFGCRRKEACVPFCCYPPVCGEAGEAGSMTAVPSSAMRSWRARLGCSGESGESGGERAPLSLPLARRGSFRSRGSSRDSMATTRSPPTCTNSHRGAELSREGPVKDSLVFMQPHIQRNAVTDSHTCNSSHVNVVKVSHIPQSRYVRNTPKQWQTGRNRKLKH